MLVFATGGVSVWSATVTVVRLAVRRLPAVTGSAVAGAGRLVGESLRL
jgi:hypothetical protein